MNCGIIDTHIQINLQTLFLEKGYIEIINSIFEAELSLIVWAKTFRHLGCFCSMIVKINCTESHKRSVRISIYLRDSMNLHDNILE